MSLQVHPLADLIPAMTEAEYRDLRNDIRDHGQHEPIVLHEGQLLDGKHRYRAVLEVGLKPKTREYEGNEPAVFVISANVHRRHLTTAQRAEIARQALPHLKEQAKARMLAGQPSGHKSRGSERNRAREQAGKLVGVSGRTVAEMDHVAQTRPDLHEQVLKGEKGVREAWRETRSNGHHVPPPQTNRARIVANAARDRVEHSLAHVAGICDGLEQVDPHKASATAEPETIAHWIEVADRAARVMREFKRKMETA